MASGNSNSIVKKLNGRLAAAITDGLVLFKLYMVWMTNESYYVYYVNKLLSELPEATYLGLHTV